MGSIDLPGAIGGRICLRRGRQIVLLFGRGDVKRAEKAYAYGVTMVESTERGLGDMWAKGLFPHPFTQLAYTSRIGSFVADKGGKCALPCDAVYERATQKSIPKYPGKGVSDTGEISIDSRVGRLAIGAHLTSQVHTSSLVDSLPRQP